MSLNEYAPNWMYAGCLGVFERVAKTMSERWSPRVGFERLIDDVDHLITDTARRSGLAPRLLGLRPPIDIYDTGEQLIIEVVLPGAKRADLHLTVDQHTLTLRGHYGSRVSEEQAGYVNWIQREIGRREVAVSFPLPVPVDADEATATFEDGILRLTLPKRAELRARRIPIETSESAGEDLPGSGSKQEDANPRSST